MKDNVKDKNMSIGRKLSIVFAVVSFLFFVNLAFNLIKPINSFLLGFFGLSIYVIFISATIFCTLIAIGKTIKLNWKQILVLCLWLVSLMILLQLSTSLKLIGNKYGEYLVACYNNKFTAGGMLFGLLTFPLHFLTYTVGAFVLACAALVTTTSFMIYFVYDYFTSKKVVLEENEFSDYQEDFEDDNEDLVVKDDFLTEEEGVELTTFEDAKSKAKERLGLGGNFYKSVPVEPEEEEEEQDDYETAKNAGISKRDYIFTPYQPKEPTPNRPPKYIHENQRQQMAEPQKAISKNNRRLTEDEIKNINFLRATNGEQMVSFEEDEEEFEPAPVTPAYVKPEPVPEVQPRVNYGEVRRPGISLEEERVSANEYNTSWTQPQQQQFNIPDDVYDEQLTRDNYAARLERARAKARAREERRTREQTGPQYSQVQMQQTTELAPERKARYRRPSNYVKPPIDLLEVIKSNQNAETEDDLQEKCEILENTLASFGIPATVVSTTVGPAVTRFELQMPQGIPVKRVLNYRDDLAMSLRANGGIRIELPIAGKNAFGVEVPNKDIATVGLRDIIESYSFQGSKSLLTVALGKDITGECQVAKIDKMPHLLVAGSTGSGKSVCLNTIIMSIIYKASPEDVKLILVDPKCVEFALYAGLPHLLIPKPITDMDRTIKCLSWLIDEMERRYQKLSDVLVRNIEEYNSLSEVQNGQREKMPYIVTILDEFGDLIVQNKKELEEKVMRLTQKSRAVGIHLILATQRPSVDVITGPIKNNLPTRIAFSVTSGADSKTILDQGGAENLLGRGDMLFSQGNLPDPIRIQGAFVQNHEIINVVNFVKENNEANFDSDIEDEMFNKKTNGFDATGGDDDEFDPLLKDAVRLTIRTNGISITKVQRSFGVGYPRAGKIVDQMEKAGFVSAPDSKNQRTIFITQQEFEERFGEDL